MDEDKTEGHHENDRERWDEAHSIATHLKRIFLETNIPNEPTLLERFIASMKFTENWSRGLKWVIRLTWAIPALWAVVTIIRQIIALAQGTAG